MPTHRSPTVRRRHLGAQLRDHRDAAGLTCEEAASYLDCAASKISRIETGRVGVRWTDVRDLLDAYGVTDEEQRQALFSLAHESRQKDWWRSYISALPQGFGSYLGLEAAAATIRAYATDLLPGLLQTEDYARAMLGTHCLLGTPSEESERRVATRMARQTLLTQDDPLRLWAVLDEAALHRTVGGPDVMHAQLQHLTQMAYRANVTIQVLPFDYGAHVGMGSPFSILKFPEPGDHDVVYLETLTSSVYVENTTDVGSYTLVFDHLRAKALGAEESLPLISEVASKLA